MTSVGLVVFYEKLVGGYNPLGVIIRWEVATGLKNFEQKSQTDIAYPF